MTSELQLVEEIRAEISKLPEADRAVVETIAETLWNILRSDSRAGLALALVGAETSAALTRVKT
jgi:hypothetical protein